MKLEYFILSFQNCTVLFNTNMNNGIIILFSLYVCIVPLLFP